VAGDGVGNVLWRAVRARLHPGLGSTAGVRDERSLRRLAPVFTILGSIVAFASYLTLLNRIGAAKAGYIGVMVPIVALLISAVFEGFPWAWATFLGIAICVAGNVLVLRR
jgi:drug/metabolite transporter (DMT)-like permease